MGEHIALSLKNLSKCYKRYPRPIDRLKEVLSPGKSRAQEFWALRDINLEISQGESIGVVGQNGSGKSTLLQIIAGTLTPTTGEVQVNGRVSALLELGSGFNPDFSGRQNVFFNGQILGLSIPEIEAKFDAIAAFAEIGDFIDQPVKTYSSGMVVRLAFAVVAHTEPTILIVDEALAVGDAKFQARCMKRIRQLREQGITILLVSHDSSKIKTLCQRAVLMNQGRILEVGEPKQVIDHYIALISSDPNEIDEMAQASEGEEYIALDAATESSHTHAEILNQEVRVIQNQPRDPSDFVVTIDKRTLHHRHGNKLATIKNVEVRNASNKKVEQIETGSIFKLEVLLEAKAELPDLVVGISIRNLMGLVMYGINTHLMNIELNLNSGQQMTVVFQMPCSLNRGVYTVTVGLHSEEGLSYDWIDDIVVFEAINSNNCDGIVDLNSTVAVKQISFNSNKY